MDWRCRLKQPHFHEGLFSLIFVRFYSFQSAWIRFHPLWFTSCYIHIFYKHNSFLSRCFHYPEFRRKSYSLLHPHSPCTFFLFYCFPGSPRVSTFGAGWAQFHATIILSKTVVRSFVRSLSPSLFTVHRKNSRGFNDSADPRPDQAFILRVQGVICTAEMQPYRSDTLGSRFL